MKTNYCEGWFRAEKCISKEWTEDQAKIAHNNRGMYTVLLGGFNNPYCFVEIRNSYISVGFLDDNKREYMTHNFKEVKSDKLFLTHVYYRFYEGNSDEIIKAETYAFFKDGRIKVSLIDYKNKSEKVSESIQDVTENYTDYPEFGNYRVLTRKER